MHRCRHLSDDIMNRLFAIVTNPILRKVMMGLTGSFLVLFLCIHIVGNYLIFIGPEAYNAYSHFLLSLPFIYVIEAVLVICTLYHAIVGVWSKLKMLHDARQQGYIKRRNANKSRRNLASRTAHITGSFLLIALVAHVWSMKFGEPSIPGPERDLYAFCIQMFSSWITIGIYEISLLILGMHLFNGLGTLYESFGIAHRTWLRRIGQTVAMLIMMAYLFLPIGIKLFVAE